jgi:hypothetical protein
MSKRRRSSIISGYYLVVGGALLLGGWRTKSWWTETLGLAFVAVGTSMVIGGGEWTTWFRGELDERRRLAADHGFKVAFFVLAWWIGGVAFYASTHSVSTSVWTAGNAVAIAAAVIDYAFVLRRS